MELSIFVQDTLTFTNIDLNRYCNEFDLEACALKTKTANEVFHILCIYRPPTSNYTNFQRLLESVGCYGIVAVKATVPHIYNIY